jgi:hypothetical protein
MALQRGARPRQLRVLMLKPEQFSHDGPAFRTIVACEHRGGPQMQFFDCRKTGKSERLAATTTINANVAATQKPARQSRGLAAREQDPRSSG